MRTKTINRLTGLPLKDLKMIVFKQTISIACLHKTSSDWILAENSLNWSVLISFRVQCRILYIYIYMYINRFWKYTTNFPTTSFIDSRIQDSLQNEEDERFFRLLFFEKNDGFEHILNKSKTYIVCYCEHWNLNSCQVDTIKIMPFSQNTFSSAWLNGYMICVYKYVYISKYIYIYIVGKPIKYYSFLFGSNAMLYSRRTASKKLKDWILGQSLVIPMILEACLCVCDAKNMLFAGFVYSVSFLCLTCISWCWCWLILKICTPKV